MVSFYSRRALSPFTGTVQVIDTPQARALSLDGVHWEITYRVRDRVRQAAAPAPGAPRYQMARAASVAGGRVLPCTRSSTPTRSAGPSTRWSRKSPPPACRSPPPTAGNTGCWTRPSGSRWRC